MIIVKEIVPEDVPQIEALLEKVLHCASYTEISRLGGLTNHTYHVTMNNGEEFVVRLPGEGTEDVIVRGDEKISTELACRLGIDAELLYFGDDGCKVTRCIPHPITMDETTMKEEKHISQAAQIFRVLHGCGEDTGVPFEVFEMAQTYEKVINEHHVPMPDDYEAQKKRVSEIKEEVDALFPVKKVPCHNDPLCANWVEGDGVMYLIDWEYAGMNDGMWDVAAVSIESGFSEPQDLYFLREYLGREPSAEDRKHLVASKIYVDYLWTLWAKMRVPFDGQPMEDWAMERYDRMKGFIRDYEQI